MTTLDRITSDPRICEGQPVVRDLRYPVLLLLDLLAAGIPVQEILEDNPTLRAEDLYAALEYAAVA